MRKCESCGITDDGQKLLECAGCLSAYFCSAACQQQSWCLHKKICRLRKRSTIKIQSNWRGYELRRQLMLNDGRDRCEVCGMTNSKEKQLHICNACKLSLFCSRKCQDFAWKKRGHRQICTDRQLAVVKIQRTWRRVRRQVRRVRQLHEMERRVEIIKKGVLKAEKKHLNRRSVMRAGTLLLFWIWLAFISVVISTGGKIDTNEISLIRAESAWDKHMKSSIMEKLNTHLDESNGLDFFGVASSESKGLFHRYIFEEIDLTVGVHPHDAFNNPDWDVNWDLNLDKEEVEYVRENTVVFSNDFFSYDALSGKIGFMSIGLRNIAVLPWEDLPGYIEFIQWFIANPDVQEESLAKLMKKLVPRIKPLLPADKNENKESSFKPRSYDDFVKLSGKAMESYDELIIEEKCDAQNMECSSTKNYTANDIPSLKAALFQTNIDDATLLEMVHGFRNQSSTPTKGNVDLGATCEKHQAIVKKNEGYIIEVHNYAEFLKAVNGMLGKDGPAIFKFEIRKDVVSSKPKNVPDMMIVANVDERILGVSVGKEGEPVTFDDIISRLGGIGQPRVERRGSKIVYVPGNLGLAELSIDLLNKLKDMIGKDGPYSFQHDIVHSSNLDLELDAVRAAQGNAPIVETGIGSKFVEPIGELSKVPIGVEGKKIDMQSVIAAFEYVSTHKELEKWRKSGRSFFHEGFELEGKNLVMVWGS